MTTDDPALRAWLARAHDGYLLANPNEAEGLTPLAKLLMERCDPGARTTFPMHVTASAVVLDEDATHMLLVKHGTLGFWVQPGGHLEPGETPLQAARRELLEECGPTGARADQRWTSTPFDIDIHAIPPNPRKGEPGHEHCDFRYVFRARNRPPVGSTESEEVAWIDRRLVGRVTQGRMHRIERLLEAAGI